MPSAYPSFMLYRDPDDGTFPVVPSQVVKVYDVTHDAALADTASDVNGVVPGATVAVAPGTVLRFSVEGRSDRLSGFCENTTS